MAELCPTDQNMCRILSWMVILLLHHSQSTMWIEVWLFQIPNIHGIWKPGGRSSIPTGRLWAGVLLRILHKTRPCIKILAVYSVMLKDIRSLFQISNSMQYGEKHQLCRGPLNMFCRKVLPGEVKNLRQNMNTQQLKRLILS